jgi:transposase-like protein
MLLHNLHLQILLKHKITRLGIICANDFSSKGIICVNGFSTKRVLLKHDGILSYKPKDPRSRVFWFIRYYSTSAAKMLQVDKIVTVHYVRTSALQ